MKKLLRILIAGCVLIFVFSQSGCGHKAGASNIILADPFTVLSTDRSYAAGVTIGEVEESIRETGRCNAEWLLKQDYDDPESVMAALDGQGKRVSKLQLDARWNEDLPRSTDLRTYT